MGSLYFCFCSKKAEKVMLAAPLFRRAVPRFNNASLKLPSSLSWSQGRAQRRSNLQEEDRIKFYNWNLACIAVTVVPVAWIFTKNHDTCEETGKIHSSCDPMGNKQIKYNVELYQ